MNEPIIDTNIELVVYQSKTRLIVFFVFYLVFLVTLSGLSIGIHNTSNFNTGLVLLIGVPFLIIFAFLFETMRDFFIKTPLLRINKEGFFTRKTKDISWSHVDSIGVLPAGPGINIVVVGLRNGKKITINANKVRPPSKKIFTASPALELFKVLSVYKKSSVHL